MFTVSTLVHAMADQYAAMPESDDPFVSLAQCACEVEQATSDDTDLSRYDDDGGFVANCEVYHV